MEQAINTILSSVITLYLPFEENGTRLAVGIALSQIGTGLIMKLLGTLTFLNYIWHLIWLEKTVYIDPHESQYQRIIEYIYSKHCDKAKTCKYETHQGKTRLVVESLSSRTLYEDFYYNNKKYKIKIRLRKHTKEPRIDKRGIQKRLPFDFDIVFSTRGQIEIIEKYIDSLIKQFNQKDPNGIMIFQLNAHGIKYREVYWNSRRNKLCRTIHNTIVSSEVKKCFYDDVENFLNSEDSYLEKGIPYKRNYILYGEPGCGKSSMITAVANQHHLPIFLLDLNVLNDNSELLRVVNDIGARISVGQKYMVVLEDVDRSNIFKKTEINSDDKNTNSTGITEDCLLNVLDGIEENFGRITILTTNKLDVLEGVEALIRPGRIDQFVYTTFCDKNQIKEIIKLHLKEEVDFNIDIKITPAKLVQLLQITNNVDDLRSILESVGDFSSKEIYKVTNFNIPSVKNTIDIVDNVVSAC